MNPHKEFAIGMIAASGPVALSYVSVVVGIGTGPLVFGIYTLKLRKEWRHRND